MLASDEGGPRRRTMQEMKRLAAESVQEDTTGSWARPGAAAAAAGPPVKRFKRDSASPAPSGFNQAAAQAGPRDAWNELPESVLVFMEMLPGAQVFDGPVFKAEDIIDCIRSANVPYGNGVTRAAGREGSCAELRIALSDGF